MSKFLAVVIMLAMILFTALYVGKTTMTSNELTIERPLLFAGTILIMIGFMLYLIHWLETE